MEEAHSGEVFELELAELRANWDDPLYHHQLVSRFTDDHDLGFVGALYRRVRDEDPERRVQAEQYMDKLFVKALRSVHPERSITPRPPNQLRFVVLGAACFTVAYLILSLFHRM